MKDWLEPKLVRNIQVFLGFANFYWQFIQGFSRITASLISILKTTKSLDKSAPSKNNGSKSRTTKTSQPLGVIMVTVKLMDLVVMM